MKKSLLTKALYYTAYMQWFKCKYCKKTNVFTSPEGVKALRKWRKKK